MPFAIRQESIANVSVDHRGYANLYINNTTGLTVTLPRTENANRLETAIPLAIEVAAWCNNKHAPIPCEPIFGKDKLAVEGDLAETKIIHGRHFNFRTPHCDPPKT